MRLQNANYFSILAGAAPHGHPGIRIPNGALIRKKLLKMFDFGALHRKLRQATAC
jgi:hypothetical protein